MTKKEKKVQVRKLMSKPFCCSHYRIAQKLGISNKEASALFSQVLQDMTKESIKRGDPQYEAMSLGDFILGKPPRLKTMAWLMTDIHYCAYCAKEFWRRPGISRMDSDGWNLNYCCPDCASMDACRIVDAEIEALRSNARPEWGLTFHSIGIGEHMDNDNKCEHLIKDGNGGLRRCGELAVRMDADHHQMCEHHWRECIHKHGQFSEYDQQGDQEYGSWSEDEEIEIDEDDAL
jgi:hypothetical protein